MKQEKSISELHEPVLLNEVLEVFDLKSAHLNKSTKIIDATLGLGGHTEAMVKKGVSVLGIDADSEMLKLAKERLDIACPGSHSNMGSFKLVHANFTKIEEVAKANDFFPANGILFDLGVSSPQITSSKRGFSFRNSEAILDMRVDTENTSVRGLDLLNLLRRDQLMELFSKTLDYKNARRISDEIIAFRSMNKFETVGDFNMVIESVLRRQGKTNISTLPFLALRIAVNSELYNLEEVLPKSVSLLKTKGKLVVISFHSGEDSVVKNTFKDLERKEIGVLITKNPITPSEEEIDRNVRARSALLRVFEKL